jgi:molybdopterin-guanine dinucleotide biosynthesis protein A
MTDLAALVLAGGQAQRMGGADKPSLLVGGTSLLDRVIGACEGCAIVVVGPERPTVGPVTFTRETPPGGGPVAALAAGLPLVVAPRVAVLAADLPFLTSQTLGLLVSRVTGDVDGALLVDDTGRDQLLAGVWRTRSLRELVAGAGPPQGLGLGRLLAALTVVRVLPGELRGAFPDGPPPWQDCDTPEDLIRAEELA